MPPDGRPAGAARRAAVAQALASVLDPELDEPLAELGFIEAVTVEGRRVAVTLRLPTYWCAAGFAYIMGEDIVAAVGSLPWVEAVDCRLVDHFAMRRINDGLAAGLSFAEAFGAEAGGDLAPVRATFAEKGFLARQATVLQAMRRERLAPEAILATTIGALRGRAARAGAEHARQIARYLEARRARPPAAAGDLAFVTADGAPIPPDGLLAHLRDGRRIGGSMRANAEMCRILLAARYGASATEGGPPTGER